MNEEPLEPLSLELAGLVAAEKLRAGPGAAQQAALWAKLGASTAAGAAATGIAVKVALAFAVGLGAGGGLVVAFAPARVIAVPQPIVFDVKVPVPVEVPVEVPTPAEAPAPPEAPKPKPPAAKVKNLDAERQLLEAARAALQRGNPAQALEHLRQHELRHPGGDFVEEREALAVQALAAKGEKAAAAERAAKFRARFKGSLLLPVVDQAVNLPLP